MKLSTDNCPCNFNLKWIDLVYHSISWILSSLDFIWHTNVTCWRRRSEISCTILFLTIPHKFKLTTWSRHQSVNNTYFRYANNLVNRAVYPSSSNHITDITHHHTWRAFICSDRFFCPGRQKVALKPPALWFYVSRAFTKMVEFRVLDWTR
jgi:hypothetical protein